MGGLLLVGGMMIYLKDGKMYKIISKQFKHELIGNLKTLKEANEELIYITEHCDLYKKEELEIIK